MLFKSEIHFKWCGICLGSGHGEKFWLLQTWNMRNMYAAIYNLFGLFKF